MNHLASNCWTDSTTKKGEDYDEAEELLRVARTLSTWRDTIASPSAQQHQQQRPAQQAVESDVDVVSKSGDSDDAEKWDKGELREGHQNDNDSTRATAAGSEEMHSETASSPNLPSDTNSVSSVHSSSADPHCTKASEVHYTDLSYVSNSNQLNCCATEVNNQAESKASLTNNGALTTVVDSPRASKADRNNLASKFFGNEITICTVHPSDAVNIDLSSRIQKNAAFSSFEEFNQAFTAWKLQYHHPFRVASSETLRQPDDGVEHKIFKYRYIVYHCAFYGEPRKRGVGKRPKQTYMPCGCRAMLRLNHNSLKRALVITTLNSEHQGHDVSADNFARVSMKIRKLSPNSDDSEPSPGSARSASSSMKSHLSSPINILTSAAGECGANVLDKHHSASEKNSSRADDTSLIINCSPKGTGLSSSSSTSSTTDSQYNAHYHQLPQVSPLIDASSVQKFTVSAAKKVGRYSNIGSGGGSQGQLSAIPNRPSNRSGVPYQDSIELSLMAAVAKASPSSTAASRSLTSSSSSSAPLPSPMFSSSEQHHPPNGHDSSVVSSTADYTYDKSAGIGNGLNNNGPLQAMRNFKKEENITGMRNNSTVRGVTGAVSAQPPTSAIDTTKFAFPQQVEEESVTFSVAPSSTVVHPSSSHFSGFNDAKDSGALASSINNANTFGSLIPDSGGNISDTSSSSQQQVLSMLLSFISSSGSNMHKPNLQQPFNTTNQQPSLKNCNEGLLLALKEMNANGNTAERALDFGTHYNQPVFASHGVHQQPMNASNINSLTGSNSCEQFLSLLRGAFNGPSTSGLNQPMVNGNLLPQSSLESQLKSLQSLQRNQQNAEEMSNSLFQNILPMNSTDSRTLLSNNLSLLDLMQPLTNNNLNKSLPAAPQQQTHGHILQLIDQLKQRQTHQSSGLTTTSTMGSHFPSTSAAFSSNSKLIGAQSDLLLDSSSRQAGSIINAVLQANFSTNKDDNNNGSLLESIKNHIKNGEDWKNLEMLEQRFQDTGKSAAESLLESVFEEGKLLVHCILDRMYGAPNVVEFVARLKQFVDSLPSPNLPSPLASSSTFKR